MYIKNTTFLCFAALSSAHATVIFQTNFDEANLGAISGLGIDTPAAGAGVDNDGSGTITLNSGSQTLDFTASKANLWNGRDGAPIAWVASPIVTLGETWYVETQVNMVNDTGGNTTFDQAGITFYADADGANPGGANDSFALVLNDWNNWTVQNAAFSVGGATNSSNGVINAADTNIFLRAEITEGGATDTYNFFFKEEAGDAWTQLGGIAENRMGSFDNSRVGLVLKSHNNNINGAAQFDSFTVGTIGAVPEPSTGILTGIAGLSLALRRRR